MTDNTPEPEALRERFAKVLSDHAIVPEQEGFHGWRCGHPDRYPGYCHCVPDLLDDLMAAAEARALPSERCAYHKPDCTHYCENGHVTADEAVMVDMERIHWKERAEKAEARALPTVETLTAALDRLPYRDIDRFAANDMTSEQFARLILAATPATTQAGATQVLEPATGSTLPMVEVLARALHATRTGCVDGVCEPYHVQHARAILAALAATPTPAPEADPATDLCVDTTCRWTPSGPHIHGLDGSVYAVAPEADRG